MRVIDLHVDTLSGMYGNGFTAGEKLTENSLDVDLRRAVEYKPYAAFYALYGNSAAVPIEGRAEALYSIYKSMTSGFGRAVTSSAELDAAVADGKVPMFLSVEGAEMIGASPEGVEWAYERGARLFGVTWNNPNGLTDGIDGGLTARGREYLDRIASLGAVCDISHLSDAAVADIFREYDSLRVIASHSNCRALRAHRRNLTDDQIRELIARRGLIGLNIYSEFVAEGEAAPSDLTRHAEHIASLGGADSLALGTDFDGCDRKLGLGGVGDLAKLWDAFAAFGFSDGAADAIFYKNSYTFWR